MEDVLLGDVCKTATGGTPSRSVNRYFQGDVPWVKSGELPDGMVLHTAEKITEEAINHSNAKVLPQGTLLIALYGATIGRLGVLGMDACTNQAICAIHPNKTMDKKYLFWYLRKIRSELIAQSAGGAQLNISQSIIRKVKIPIHPLAEQKRIVSEIEKMFTRLDKVEAVVFQTQKNIKSCREKILSSFLNPELNK